MAKFRPEPEESPALIPPPRLPPTAVGLATVPPAIPPGGSAMTRICYYRSALLVALLLPTLLWSIPGVAGFVSGWATAVSLLALGYAYVVLVEIFRTTGERRGWLLA